MGILISSGHRLDDILDLTWDQIHLAAESVVIHKTESLNMVLEPLIGMMGGKYKRGKVTKRQRRKQKDDKNIHKEQMLLNRFRAAGLSVTENE